MHPATIVLAIAVIAVLLLAMIYNRLVALRQARKSAFSDIDVQLKQRASLVPNLVESVKGYAGHEKEIFEAVTQARAAVGQTGNSAGPDRIAAENGLSAGLGRLLAVSENYPALKADANFRQLMDNLSDLENKIAAARRYFNNATSEYNTAIQQFPASLFAGIGGFHEEPFFELGADEKAAVNKDPDVKF